MSRPPTPRQTSTEPQRSGFTACAPSDPPTSAGLATGSTTTLAGQSYSDSQPAFISTSTASSSVVALPAGFITAAAPRAATRVVRKAKAHVASACVNCKKAHLSCDVERPCKRCRDTGKEDTCHDVQHKKRGRPRLREETESETASSSQQTYFQSTAARPIAATRSRRAESFRSHQSQGSESSSIGQITPTSRYLTAVPASLQPIGPTLALLDLDLHVLRMADTLQHILGDVTGRTDLYIGDLIEPAEGSESLASLRNHIRSERERREPAYLPPILEQGRDPWQSLRDEDLGHWTQGPPIANQMWTLRQGGQATSIPVSIWLAKSSVYFVVVTTSGWSPVQQGAMPLSTASQPPDQDMLRRQTAGLTPRERPTQAFLSQTADSPRLQGDEQRPYGSPPGRSNQAITLTTQMQPSSLQYSPPYYGLDESPRNAPYALSSTARMSEASTAGPSSQPEIVRPQARSARPEEETRSGSEAPSAKRRRRINIDDVLE